MKLEIANEIGVETNNKYGSNNTSYENGQLGDMPYGKMFSFKDQDGNDYLLREDEF